MKPLTALLLFFSLARLPGSEPFPLWPGGEGGEGAELALARPADVDASFLELHPLGGTVDDDADGSARREAYEIGDALLELDTSLGAVEGEVATHELLLNVAVLVAGKAVD